MNFIEPTLEVFTSKLSNLSIETKPSWGTMNAQRMVEHLTDSFMLATGEINLPLEIAEDKVDRAQVFLKSEHPLPKNFAAGYAPANAPLRNDSLEAAINEFELKWGEFQAFFEQNPDVRTTHPSFGNLDLNLWMLLHSKHITHHFEQFGLI